MVRGQLPANVRRAGERHKIVRQTDSGLGVDARASPGGFLESRSRLCPSCLFLMTFAMGGILHAGSRQCRVFPGGLNRKEFACNAGNPGSISGSGRSLGEGNDNLLQYSCLENSMNRERNLVGYSL